MIPNYWARAPLSTAEKAVARHPCRHAGGAPLLPGLLPAGASCRHHSCSPFPAAPKVGALPPMAKEPSEQAQLLPHLHGPIANCFHGFSMQTSGVLYSVYTAAEVRYSVWKIISIWGLSDLVFLSWTLTCVYPHISEYAQSTYFYHQHALDR